MNTLPDELVSAYFHRFVVRTDAYQKQCASNDRCWYTAVYEPVTMDLIRAHLGGNITLSFPAVNTDGLCKWCAWDSDNENVHLDRLAAILTSIGFNPLREAQRPGRDGHLWLLFDQPVPATDIIRFEHEVRMHAGVPATDVEFFPKQAESGKLGSGLRGPLGIHRKPGAQNVRGWFEGLDKSVPEQLMWLAQQPLNRAANVIAVARKLRHFDAEPKRYRLDPVIRPYKTGSVQPVNILELISDKRKIGTGWAAQCPVCAREGHDRHRDNLRIRLDGQKFCCVYGGPGQVHKGREIVAAQKARLILSV